MDQNASAKIPVNIEDEMKRSYMDYAMSVIIGRALPDDYAHGEIQIGRAHV